MQTQTHHTAVEALQARLVDEDVLEPAELQDARGMQPTTAFCKVCGNCLHNHSIISHTQLAAIILPMQQALDREDDYDEAERMATETYQETCTRQGKFEPDGTFGAVRSSQRQHGGTKRERGHGDVKQAAAPQQQYGCVQYCGCIVTHLHNTSMC